jgi:hypothetical protein
MASQILIIETMIFLYKNRWRSASIGQITKRLISLRGVTLALGTNNSDLPSDPLWKSGGQQSCPFIMVRRLAMTIPGWIPTNPTLWEIFWKCRLYRTASTLRGSKNPIGQIVALKGEIFFQ